MSDDNGARAEGPADLPRDAAIVATFLRQGRAAQRARLLRESGLTPVDLDHAILELERLGIAHADGGRVRLGSRVVRLDARRDIWPSDGSIPTEPTLDQLLEVLKRFTEEHRGANAWRVLRSRYGLAGAEPTKHRGIAASMGGASRQAAQQSEAGSIRMLRSLVTGESVRRRVLHPDLVAAFARLAAEVVEAPLGVRAEDELQAALQLRGADAVRTLPFVLRVLGLRVVDHPQLKRRYWLAREDGAVVLSAVAALRDAVIDAGARGIDPFDLVGKVNDRTSGRSRFDDLDALIELTNDVDTYGGRVRAELGFLSTRADQIERLFADADAPMRVERVARALNQVIAAAGGDPLGLETVRNLLSKDPRFLATGRVGTWILKDWKDRYDTEGIVPLMERALASENRAMTAAELYELISGRRSLSPKSIDTYLGLRRDLFERLAGGRWALRDWRSDEGWSRARVTTWVDDFFGRTRGDVRFTDLRKQLEAVSDLAPKSAAKALEGTGAVRVELRGSVRYAHHLPAGARAVRSRPRRTATLRDQVEQRVRALLEAAPPEGMALQEVLAVTQREFARPEATLRQYIAKIPWLEQVAVPGSRLKLCRVRGEEFLLRKSTELVDGKRRETIQRAIRLLTVEQVDVGLFLFAKELEATMRAYLRVAGVMPHHQNWMLGALITEAGKAGLITDTLHLDLLRQQRNERGHGEAPSLDERKLLLEKAGFWAGLYLDYILFFERRIESGSTAAE